MDRRQIEDEIDRLRVKVWNYRRKLQSASDASKRGYYKLIEIEERKIRKLQNQWLEVE